MDDLFTWYEKCIYKTKISLFSLQQNLMFIILLKVNSRKNSVLNSKILYILVLRIIFVSSFFWFLFSLQTKMQSCHSWEDIKWKVFSPVVFRDILHLQWALLTCKFDRLDLDSQENDHVKHVKMTFWLDSCVYQRYIALLKEKLSWVTDWNHKS